MKSLNDKAIKLLEDLISIKSFSGEEDKTAERIGQWFSDHNIPFKKQAHNIYAFNFVFHHSFQKKPLANF